MQNSVTQYFPDFYEGFTALEVSFDTTDELVNIPFIKHFSEQPGFDFYAKSLNHPSLLMAVYNKESTWYVIAFLDNPDLVDLPVWDCEKVNKSKPTRPYDTFDEIYSKYEKEWIALFESLK